VLCNAGEKDGSEFAWEEFWDSGITREFRCEGILFSRDSGIYGMD
jgi:hypothetical protein